MNVKSVIQTMISTRTITQENASIANWIYASIVKTLLTASSVTNRLTISSTLLPFVRNVQLKNAFIVQVWHSVSNVTKRLTISSTLLPFVRNVQFKNAFIVQV